MSGLNDIASITISSETAAITQQGFGIPLILSVNAAFTERVRSYADLTELVADFAATTPEYRMASVLFAQSPRPPTIMVGRRALKPTQRWKVTPVAANTTVYKLKVGSETADPVEVSFTSDGSATLTEIITGLKAAIDALSLALTVSDQTTYMRIVANTAGAWFTVETTTSPISNLTVEQDHADPGLATDLDNIALENSDWYCILNAFNSAAEIAAIAGWAESNTKLFVAQTQDTPVITVASGSDTSSIAYTLKNSARVRTSLHYHPYNGAFLDAALAGKCLPKAPGSETWALKQLSGPGAVKLTSTHKTNARAKNCGLFYSIAGINLSFDGKVSSGTYVDIVRGRDWLSVRLQERFLSVLSTQDKVPYTDDGIATIEAEVKAQLQEGIDVGLLAANPKPKVSVPLAANVSGADKTARILRGVKFDAVLQGAVQKLDITGNLSV